MYRNYHTYAHSTIHQAVPSGLSVPHTAKGTPWEKARKKSPDKWGVIIEDADISDWFSKRMYGQ